MDDDKPSLALAVGRVRKAAEIVARQRALVGRLMLSGGAFAGQADLLQLFEENLAIFERHLAVLRAPQPLPAPSSR